MRIFKKPEARMMMGAFNNMESIHQHAYSLLLDTVGMPEVEYKAFSEYEAMADKHEYIKNIKVSACRSMVDLEDRFLDLVFQMGDIQGLTKKEMQSYIRYIADRRLLQLGLKPNYGVKDNPLTWLDDVLGVEHQNFFEGRATSYMKAGLRGSVEVVNFAEIVQ